MKMMIKLSAWTLLGTVENVCIRNVFKFSVGPIPVRLT